VSATCPACGANVDVARDVDSGEIVALEVYTDAGPDAPRYRVLEVSPLIVARVPDHAVGDYYPDHRFDCKDANAGRTF
jgi:hypothetical protein